LALTESQFLGELLLAQLPVEAGIAKLWKHRLIGDTPIDSRRFCGDDTWFERFPMGASHTLQIIIF